MNKPFPFLHSFFFFFFLIYLSYLFIFGCLGSSLLRTGFSLVVVSEGYSSLWCVGFSLPWLLLLQSMGSKRPGFRSCASRAVEHRLSRHMGLVAPQHMGSSGPGIKPMPPELVGRFLTTAQPGKPYVSS